MTSNDLAAQVKDVVAEAQARITGVGDEQYSDLGENGEPVQKFEGMAFQDLLTYLEEETLDLINYGVMLTIRVRRMRAEFEAIYAPTT